MSFYKELGKKLRAHHEHIDDKVERIDKYQKYVNTELDYGVFEVTDMNVTNTIPLVFSSVISGNMEISENGYIKLQKGKSYVLHVDLYRTEYDVGVLLVDSNLNVLSEPVTSGHGSYIYSAEEDIEVTFVAEPTNTLTVGTKWSCVNVYEINRQIVIDPLNYVNESQGIEDTPVGHIISHIGTTAPKHYLICNGAEYNITDYPHLAQHIENSFGSINFFGGDGETTFAVPNENSSNPSMLYCIKYEPTYFMNIQGSKVCYLLNTMYSKEEKVIGSWINGKPLYQKTLTTKVPKTSTQIALNMSDLKVDNMVNFVSNFSNEEIINTAPNISGDNHLSFWYNKSAKLLHITCTEEQWYGWDLYITVQYTKSTDEENSFNDTILDGSPTTDYSDEDITNAINALW